jgi:hypothetical protein
MVAGRPSGLELDTNHPLPVAQHVSDIDVRGRVYVPAWFTAEIAWFRPDIQVLAIFDEPGLIRLCSWAEHSQPVIERRRRLADLGDFEGVRLLEDRYRSVHIPADRRPTLGDAAKLHLGIAEIDKAFVYLIRVEDTLRVISADYRNRDLQRVRGSFAGLP